MQPQQPAYGPSQSGSNPYDFIVNPNAGPSRRRVPGSNSVVLRLLLVLGGIFLLFIAFVVGKNLLLVDSTNTPLLISAASQQQELIHLSGKAVLVTTIDSTTKNSALTSQLTLTSQQQQLLVYLKANGHKVAPKQLSTQISLATDQQLTASLAASTYDATFRQIMTTKLTTYKQTLQQAYAKTSGAVGKALLNKDYDSAQLLLQQLSPTGQ
jgi:hypothetical protein